MSKLWNAVIAPRVQDAILSRASVKRQPGLGQTIAKKHPSQGQQAVVKAALSILLNKAVLHGCPLPRAGMWARAGRRGNSQPYIIRVGICFWGVLFSLFVTREIISTLMHISQLCPRTLCFNYWLMFKYQPSKKNLLVHKTPA